MRCISMRSAAPVRNDRVQPSPPSACRTVQGASGCCARRLSATITSVPDRSRREPASRSDSNGQSGPESQDAVPPRSAGCTRCRRSGGRGCRGRENRRSRTTTRQLGNLRQSHLSDGSLLTGSAEAQNSVPPRSHAPILPRIRGVSPMISGSEASVAGRESPTCNRPDPPTVLADVCAT